ncbi:LysR family transcriptional regulator [Citrobacter freundii]|uniref:LysR family transcriptional regulator n=1 Tax=Citrobacter TaxID=544 RepID=UPI00214DAFA7|nr:MULTISPECIES: LysR family transcriptional regulator [Citrobacter]MCR3713754.1 LysR family transcriptional regulator [Citrobacter freundii]MDM3231778.1 LysR family transcriptional regulator [Citrobacter sp. Cf078]
MNLRDVETFCAIAEAGNLTQAARKLNATAMTVSRRLAQLENELGVRLFQRTTRAVSLTNEGEEFLPYARAMKDAEQNVKSMFSKDNEGAYGLLRVTAPSGFGNRNILPLLPALMDANPKMKVELNLCDDVIDIVGQGYDIAIRIAPLKDSRLIAHKLADNPRILCASPHYLHRHGLPKYLKDLRSHHCLKNITLPYWMFDKEGNTINHVVDARFSCSNVESVRAMCVNGSGIAQLTRIDVSQELNKGELVELSLEDVAAQELSVWALLPTLCYLPLRATTFLNALKKSFNDVTI